ncbi:MAG TPA: histidine phosphatase family protein [Candidatus Saccharimonadales bacterium]|nr:histidine phosphatase family protein [Candidatus Saccharimonadales bacterium]
MLEIYLCRHGQSQANADGVLAGHLDSPLTNRGRDQAHRLGELAKANDLKFDHIYVSPLQRCKETAEIIAEETGSPQPEIMDELIERDFGLLSGKPYTDIDKYAKTTLRTDNVFYFLDGEKVETFPQALARAQKILENVQARHKRGKILLATHGDIGMMIFAAFHKTAWKEALTRFDFGNSELLLLKEDLFHEPHVFEIKEV